MGNIISKIMLGLSVLFFLGVILIIVSILASGFFQGKELMLMACIALSGIFLGLYRMIVLLESRK